MPQVSIREGETMAKKKEMKNPFILLAEHVDKCYMMPGSHDDNDPQKLDEELWQLCVLGVLYCEFANNGKRYYHIPNWAPGIVEYMVGNMDKFEGVAECFDEYAQLSRNDIKLMSPDSGGMRVIPVMKEVEAEPRALSYEQVLK